MFCSRLQHIPHTTIESSTSSLGLGRAEEKSIANIVFNFEELVRRVTERTGYILNQSDYCGLHGTNSQRQSRVLYKHEIKATYRFQGLSTEMWRLPIPKDICATRSQSLIPQNPAAYVQMRWLSLCINFVGAKSRHVADELRVSCWAKGARDGLDVIS